MASLTGKQRSETYRALLTGDVVAPVTGMNAATRYTLTWGDGSTTGVSVGNGEVGCTKVILGAMTLQAGGTGTITFPNGGGTVYMTPASGTVMVRPASGTFYLGQASVSIGTTSVNAHTFTSAATAARAVNIEDVAGTLLIRPASGNIYLGTTFSSGPSAANAHTHTSLATVPRTITWPDASGTPVLQAPGQLFVAAFTSTLASDFTNSTLTPAAVPFPTLTLGPGLYRVQAFLMLSTTNTAGGVRYKLPFTGGAVIDSFNGAVVDPNDVNESAATNAPSALIGLFCEEKVYTVYVASSATLAPTLFAENASYPVTMKAGSIISALKIG